MMAKPKQTGPAMQLTEERVRRALQLWAQANNPGGTKQACAWSHVWVCKSRMVSRAGKGRCLYHSLLSCNSLDTKSHKKLTQLIIIVVSFGGAAVRHWCRCYNATVLWINSQGRLIIKTPCEAGIDDLLTQVPHRLVRNENIKQHDSPRSSGLVNKTIQRH